MKGDEKEEVWRQTRERGAEDRGDMAIISPKLKDNKEQG
jgi:hypothetical protein